MMDANNIQPDAPFKTGVTGKYKLLIKSVTPKYSNYEYELTDIEGKEYLATCQKHYPENNILRCIVSFSVERAKLVVTETTICGKQDFTQPLPSSIKEKVKTKSTVNRYRFDTYLQAVAAVTKAYPLVLQRLPRAKITTNNQAKSITIGSHLDTFTFDYKSGSYSKVTFHERAVALRAILFCFAEIRTIDSAIIKLAENLANSSFELKVNDLLVYVCRYCTYTGTFENLKQIKDGVLQGTIKPDTFNDLDCQKIGKSFVAAVKDYLLFDHFAVDPTVNAISHKETIKVSSKAGKKVVEPKLAQQFKGQSEPKVVFKGKSKPQKGPAIPSWMDKWNDRFDHDD